MHLPADADLIRGFCRRGILPLPPRAIRIALALAGDDQSHNADLFSQIESDPRLEFTIRFASVLPPLGRGGRGGAHEPVHLPPTTNHPSPHQVLLHLGRRKTLSLLWLVALSDFLLTWPPFDERIRDRLGRHSLLTGLLADELASLLPNPLTGDPLIAGLAHDIGHLLIARPGPQLTLLREDEPIELDDVPLSPSPERDHCRLGAALMTLWNAPDEVVSCALHHHDPVQTEPEFRAIVTGVRLADLLAEHVALDRPGPRLALAASPVWRQLATLEPWSRIPQLDQVALERLPDAVVFANRAAELLS